MPFIVHSVLSNERFLYICIDIINIFVIIIVIMIGLMICNYDCNLWNRRPNGYKKKKIPYAQILSDYLNMKYKA